jgi:hypothetical protein
MAFRGDPRTLLGSAFGPLLLCGFAGVALAGCAMRDGVGTLGVDPAVYAALHCKDLVTRWKQLVEREAELRALMDKAGEGAGGTVIGTLTYRSDYEIVLSEKKLTQRTAAEKKCVLEQTAPAFQSDQLIR